MRKKPCPHCAPYQAEHRQEWLDYWVNIITSLIENSLGRLVQVFNLDEKVWVLFIRLLSLSQVASWRKLELDQVCFSPKLTHVLQEAERQGLGLERFHVAGKGTTTFRARNSQQKVLFDEVPGPVNYPRRKHFIDDKVAFRKFLQQQDYPVPLGRSFFSWSRAKVFARSVDYPLVVKPPHSSLSKHATYPVKDEAGLKKAFLVAKQISPVVLVEEFVPGTIFRATTVYNQLVAAASRHAGEAGADGVAKVIVAAGATIVDITDEVHPENKKLFEEISEQLGGVILGLDIIAEDLSRSWRDQRFVFIEGNTFPAIEMHHEPTVGRARNVAGAIWNGVDF